MDCNCGNSLQNCNCSEPIELISRGERGITGAAGPTSADGIDGTSLLHNDISINSTTAVGVIDSYTLPADTLADNDMIEIEVCGNINSSSLMISEVKILFDSEEVGVVRAGNTGTESMEFIFNINIYRSSSTVAKYDYRCNYRLTSSSTMTTIGSIINSNITTDFTGDIDIEISTSFAIFPVPTYRINRFTVKKLKKLV